MINFSFLSFSNKVQLKIIFLKFIILLNLLLTPNFVFAAFANYNSILIGDQAAGLGGAYTALYGDTAGGPYYNPAGLAWMEGNSFSASVSIYKKFDTVIGSEEDFIKAPLRVNQGFFQSIPSSTGSLFKYEDFTLGMSIVVPDYETFKGDISNAGNNTSTLSYLDQSLWVGGTAAKKIDKWNSLGLTVYYTARDYNRTVQDRTVDIPNNTVNLYSEEKSILGNSVVIILGHQHHFNQYFFSGLSVRLPSIEISGTGSYFSNEVKTQKSTTDNSYALSITPVSQPSLASHTRIPGKISLGFAYQDFPIKISLDGSIYFAEKYFDIDLPTYRSKVQHQLMGNGAFGIEYQPLPNLILRTGWFTNLTSYKNLNIDDKYGDRVDQLGWAANFTFITKEQVHFTFGGYYVGGRGKSIQRINQEYTISSEMQQVFTMLLSTSYAF